MSDAFVFDAMAWGAARRAAGKCTCGECQCRAKLAAEARAMREKWSKTR